MICSIRPGRGDITTTRSASSTASSMLWVTNSTVLRVRSHSASRSMRICSRVSASSAPNGSSISSSGGSWISARTIEVRWRMPPESSRGRLVEELAQPHRLQQRDRAFAIGRGAQTAQFHLHQHVVQHVAPLEQHRVLEHDAEIGDRPRHRVAIGDDLARARAQQPGDQPQQRALAAAGRSDDGDELALRDTVRSIEASAVVVTLRCAETSCDRPRATIAAGGSLTSAGSRW